MDGILALLIHRPLQQLLVALKTNATQMQVTFTLLAMLTRRHGRGEGGVRIRVTAVRALPGGGAPCVVPRVNEYHGDSDRFCVVPPTGIYMCTSSEARRDDETDPSHTCSTGRA